MMRRLLSRASTKPPLPELCRQSARPAVLALLSLSLLPVCAPAADIRDRVEHGYADSNGVKIHYASLGRGPLIVMVHGFPDFWYTWRNQMEELSRSYRTVAIDMRGYNLSDKPKGVENYDMKLLVSDVVAVIRHLGEKQAILVGHDWGGAVCWNVAMFSPDSVGKLIILNLPHPTGLARELATILSSRQIPRMHASSRRTMRIRSSRQKGSHGG